ncbi:MAG: sodium:proton antiporter [Polyangiaceae bacterium]
MHQEIVFIGLFAVASMVAVAARRFRVPYTVALVVAGLLLGTAHGFEPPHLTKELLYAIFLPGLLFEAAFHLDFKKFWYNKLAIHALAVPGLMVAIGLTAVILTPVAAGLGLVDHFSIVHGLVFASLIAATDPIAVVGLFKSLGAPKRLAVLVEGESLLNDGTAVVIFSMVLAIANGGAFSASHAASEFVAVVGMGTLIGAGIGYAVSKAIQQVDDAMVEITLTTVAAYGAFALAEQFHYSGVIATVVAGMLCGNYGASTGMSPSTRVAVESFWEYLAFALNSFVFLLLGLEVELASLLRYWQVILIGFLAVSLGRAVVIFGVSGLLRLTRERMPWSWSLVLTWGGLRGALSMVLVLSLRPDFPHRELLVNMTFGVVLISIIMQGLSMGPLLRRLSIVSPSHDRHEYETRRGALLAASAGLRSIEQLVQARQVHADAVTSLKRDYEERVGEAERALGELHLAKEALLAEEYESAKRHALLVERTELSQGLQRGVLSEEAYDRLVRNIDASLLELEQGSHWSDPSEPGKAPSPPEELAAEVAPRAEPPAEASDDD